MTDGNDREDLEKRVAELEATVRGLTEELVDATERIRQLEEEHGRHEPATETREARGEWGADAAGDAPGRGPDDSPAGDGEAGKSQEPQSSDENDETDESDDIIVA